MTEPATIPDQHTARILLQADRKMFPSVLIEVPPRQVLVRYGDTTFQVWTPYLLAITHGGAQSLFITARNCPVTAKDDILYNFYWPHVSGYGQVCIAALAHDQREEIKEIEGDPLLYGLAIVNNYLVTGYQYFLRYDENFLPWQLREKACRKGRPFNSYNLNPVFEQLEKMSLEEVLAMDLVPFNGLEINPENGLSAKDWFALRTRGVAKE